MWVYLIAPCEIDMATESLGMIQFCTQDNVNVYIYIFIIVRVVHKAGFNMPISYTIQSIDRSLDRCPDRRIDVTFTDPHISRYGYRYIYIYIYISLSRSIDLYRYMLQRTIQGSYHVCIGTDGAIHGVSNCLDSSHGCVHGLDRIDHDAPWRSI
jgi:hypothetical protein